MLCSKRAVLVLWVLFVCCDSDEETFDASLFDDYVGTYQGTITEYDSNIGTVGGGNLVRHEPRPYSAVVSLDSWVGRTMSVSTDLGVRMGLFKMTSDGTFEVVPDPNQPRSSLESVHFDGDSLHMSGGGRFSTCCVYLYYIKAKKVE